MAFADEVLKGVAGSGAGVAAGVGALVLAPFLAPAIGKILRPAAVTILKSGIVLYREVGDYASELVHEARSELQASSPVPAAPLKPAPPPRAKAKRPRTKRVQAQVAR